MVHENSPVVTASGYNYNHNNSHYNTNIGNHWLSLIAYDHGQPLQLGKPKKSYSTLE